MGIKVVATSQGGCDALFMPSVCCSLGVQPVVAYSLLSAYKISCSNF